MSRSHLLFNEDETIFEPDADDSVLFLEASHTDKHWFLTHPAEQVSERAINATTNIPPRLNSRARAFKKVLNWTSKGR